MIHAVIFDIDDTLLHSMSADDVLYRQAIRDTVGKVRFRAQLADYQHVSDFGILREVLNDNGIAATDDTTAAIQRRFLDSLAEYVETNGPFREIDGARKLIDRLRASNDHAVALATGCWRESAQLKLHTAGFDVADLPLATADDAVPRVDIMQTALRALPTGLASITYFGDGVWDQRACASLGWRFRPVGPGLNGIGNYHGEYIELQTQ
ncbi:MAG: HAD family hydrolase [Woeseia sp.]